MNCKRSGGEKNMKTKKKIKGTKNRLESHKRKKTRHTCANVYGRAHDRRRALFLEPEMIITFNPSIIQSTVNTLDFGSRPSLECARHASLGRVRPSMDRACVLTRVGMRGTPPEWRGKKRQTRIYTDEPANTREPV